MAVSGSGGSASIVEPGSPQGLECAPMRSPFVLAQYLMPKQAMTRFAGRVAGAGAGPLTRTLIRGFIARYGVDMSEAEHADPAAYPTFNAFFTRALRPGIRPIAATGLVCPVDGAISQFGAIDADRIFQAKGHRYSTTALVGGDAALAGEFRGGSFATLYLSPRDYHRIHMPCDGRLVRMIHVPGDLFSVNPVTVAGVPGLFARNERVVCVFESVHAARGCWCSSVPRSSAAWPRSGTASSTRRVPAICGNGAIRIDRQNCVAATRWAASCSARPS